MALTKIADITSNILDGFSHTQHVYKPSVPAAGFAGGWIDTSMSAGIPIYNAYVAGQTESTALYGFQNKGVYLGNASDKRLLNAMFQTRSAVVPATVLLLDYLMFYALCDLDSTDLQEMTVLDVLPRYTSGEGVMIMPVITLPSIAATTCTVIYTNSVGVSNRTSTFSLLQGSVTGSIVACSDVSGTSTGNTPFVPLQSGDVGVRSIESVQFTAGVGGFVCFVLVKVLASVVIPEINTCSELSFISNKFSMPLIKSGAYLNFIIKQQVPASSIWMAQLQVIEA